MGLSLDIYRHGELSETCHLFGDVITALTRHPGSVIEIERDDEHQHHLAWQLGDGQVTWRQWGSQDDRFLDLRKTDAIFVYYELQAIDDDVGPPRHRGEAPASSFIIRDPAPWELPGGCRRCHREPGGADACRCVRCSPAGTDLLHCPDHCPTLATAAAQAAADWKTWRETFPRRSPSGEVLSPFDTGSNAVSNGLVCSTEPLYAVRHQFHGDVLRMRSAQSPGWSLVIRDEALEVLRYQGRELRDSCSVTVGEILDLADRHGCRAGGEGYATWRRCALNGPDVEAAAEWNAGYLQLDTSGGGEGRRSDVLLDWPAWEALLRECRYAEAWAATVPPLSREV